MFVHEVRLRNIRSYDEFAIRFEEGITLLSGDIGSGKSTILQAIEFSLFGIQRGGLDGESLLRHGAAEGSVAVTFTINGHEVEVARALKRTKDGVRSSDGSLMTGGVREELTANELKARVLELLGYPAELVTKSKGLIFRHTVYTPQEMMKHIIFMNPEERLNTLRVLFGIERYKAIKENTQLYGREVRASERSLKERSGGLESLKATVTELQGKQRKAVAAQDVALAEAKAASAAAHERKQRAAASRGAWEAQQALSNRRAAVQSRVRELERSLKNSFEDSERVEQYLAAAVEPVTDVSEQADAIHRELDELAEALLAAERERSVLVGERTVLERQRDDIAGLATCSVCQQPVSAEHKHAVHERSAKTIGSLSAQAAGLAATQERLRARKAALTASVATLQEQQRRFAQYQKELLVRKDREAQRDRLAARQKELVAELDKAKAELASIVMPKDDAKAAMDAAHAALDAAERVMQEKLAVLTAAKEARSTVDAQLQVATERLSDAAAAHEALLEAQALRHWLDDVFVPLLETIERHVMASVHGQFQELFQSHFRTLVEDDLLAVSLGESFEPLVSQNGYDASLEQLSGGEKTAVALSYRLALYQVVSDFIGQIHTKDVLILDEPTDGFSAEQLDRVRSVLRSLGCRQVLLVSHESRMESVCDHVVRLEKRVHRTAAVL